MGAAFLNAAAGISSPTIEQSAAYISGWQKVLKGDKRLVVTAAGAAQKEADWILGERFFEASNQKEPTPDSTTPQNPPNKTANNPSQLELFG